VITLADRLVAGEESAIAAGVDGRRPVPVFRPDKSVPIRVGRNPALVQNAETLAQVGLLFRYGPDWFRTVGTDDSPGTTLVTIVGSVALPGVHEVPFGLPIGHIVDRAGPDANWSAVLVGGYGGTWLGASARKVLYEPRALAEKGAAIGPGVLLVLGASKCGLAETARIARYMARESAGQCGPCLHGLPAIAEDLTRLVGGHGDAPTLERIRKRCRIVTGRGACKHPDGLARLVVSSLRVFSEDAEIHSSGRPCSGTRDGSILAIGRQSPESFR
ncbi:MAG TPA: NADH-ubiquinone oxidoreductase-F iron-sulfur binding region domain-containing protein, partial [Acidimicrobiales bacterium]|nr:NADH-ubiquinone oxidoreductase-F iron-sulfur binding region domain-containing protein [Acidimicrobiales bacterium]